MRLTPLFRFTAPFGVLALLLAGCDLLGSEAGHLDLRTDQAAYAAGATVTLTLENESARPYEMGPLSCAGLQRREGDDWVALESGLVCAAILIGLEAGGREEAVLQLADELPTGAYRYVHRVSRDIADDPDGLAVPSNAFEVR